MDKPEPMIEAARISLPQTDHCLPHPLNCHWGINPGFLRWQVGFWLFKATFRSFLVSSGWPSLPVQGLRGCRRPLPPQDQLCPSPPPGITVPWLCLV